MSQIDVVQKDSQVLVSEFLAAFVFAHQSYFISPLGSDLHHCKERYCWQHFQMDPYQHIMDASIQFKPVPRLVLDYINNTLLTILL